MRNTLFLIATAAAAGFSSAPAQAQWSNSGYEDDLIRCESRDGRTERCETYGGDVQLVRQLSGSQCVRGRSWGTDSRGVWVSGGCRAEFRIGSGYGYDDSYGSSYGNGYGNSYGNGYGNSYGSDYGYGSSDGLFRCESREGRTERCNGYGGRAQFIRQLSNTPCVRGRSWGSDARGVWVSNGCRALFSANGGYGNGSNYGGSYGNNYGNDLVRCESRDNRSHSCAISAGRNGNVRLLRQLSGKPCIENQTWGRTRNGVWVTQGCRAEFVAGRGGRNNNGGGYTRPPGDLGGAPGGKRPGVFENASNGRAPGDLGDAAQVSERPATEDRQRPQTIIERPRSTETVSRPQMRPVEEAPGFVETRAVEAPGRVEAPRPVEDAPPRIQSRPAQVEPGRVEQNSAAPAAEPGVEAPRPPRERGVEQGERPR